MSMCGQSAPGSLIELLLVPYGATMKSAGVLQMRHRSKWLFLKGINVSDVWKMGDFLSWFRGSHKLRSGFDSGET